MARQEYRHLYNSKRWRELRQAVFIRDLYECQSCGKACSTNPNHHHSAVCDHIKRHKGDPRLFFDPDNLQTLGSSCHNSHKQSLEKGGKGKPTIGLDGWPVN